MAKLATSYTTGRETARRWAQTTPETAFRPQVTISLFFFEFLNAS